MIAIILKFSMKQVTTLQRKILAGVGGSESISISYLVFSDNQCMYRWPGPVANPEIQNRGQNSKGWGLGRWLCPLPRKFYTNIMHFHAKFSHASRCIQSIRGGGSCPPPWIHHCPGLQPCWHCTLRPKLHLLRFALDFLYNMLYNKLKSYSKYTTSCEHLHVKKSKAYTASQHVKMCSLQQQDLSNESTMNRSSGVW